jgi:tRNA A37 threonylcarbamoyladenosine biosynthesis protein TsaE
MFNIAKENQMIALGEEFGRAILNRSVEPYSETVIRIGLCGGMGVGKTPFANGILKNLPDKISLERPPHKKAIDQNLWYDRQAGYIRHYDAFPMRDYRYLLPSYLNNDVSGLKPMRTDIVEHPYHDIHNKECDYLVYFNRAATGMREVTVLSPDQMVSTPAYQTFLEQAAALSANPVLPKYSFVRKLFAF